METHNSQFVTVTRTYHILYDVISQQLEGRNKTKQTISM